MHIRSKQKNRHGGSDLAYNWEARVAGILRMATHGQCTCEAVELERKRYGAKVGVLIP